MLDKKNRNFKLHDVSQMLLIIVIVILNAFIDSVKSLSDIIFHKDQRFKV